MDDYWNDNDREGPNAEGQLHDYQCEGKLTESDFCLLSCTPNVRFLAGITSKFIYNVGAQRSRQFVFESEK